MVKHAGNDVENYSNNSNKDHDDDGWPKLWNALPRELRDIPYLHNFKSHLKIGFLFLCFYYHCHAHLIIFMNT